MFWHHSFIYSISWEDFSVDTQLMDYNSQDTVITLCGGGCNALSTLLYDATVYAVDANPAQCHLLELKSACALHSHSMLWNTFGSPVHLKTPLSELNIELGDSAAKFWKSKAHYLNNKGLYMHGGMGWAVWLLSKFNWSFRGLHQQIAFVNKVAYVAHTRIFNAVAWVVYTLKLHVPLCWYILGVPFNQLRLIENDKRSILNYVLSTMKVFTTIPIEDNGYYYLVTHGMFLEKNCPMYLKRTNYQKLQHSLRNKRLHICNDVFVNTLQERMYTKAVLMDHMDWLSTDEQTELAEILESHIVPTGRIILRSASLNPSYIAILSDHGFVMAKINSHETHTVCDKVNMYASTFLGIKT